MRQLGISTIYQSVRRRERDRIFWNACHLVVMHTHPPKWDQYKVLQIRFATVQNVTYTKRVQFFPFNFMQRDHVI